MSLIDDLVMRFDRALRTVVVGSTPHRDNPAAGIDEVELSDSERRHASGLMRVNHTGEICAQALYEGQSLTSRASTTRAALLSAASEEVDHLAWCEQRLGELGSRPSVLNPLFYAASYAIGAATGLMGDRISLGFVEATEDRVCQHLEDHLQKLPDTDARSREIVKAMHEDEARHGSDALLAGGREFPEFVKQGMTIVSRLMTESTYRM